MPDLEPLCVLFNKYEQKQVDITYMGRKKKTTQVGGL